MTRNDNWKAALFLGAALSLVPPAGATESQEGTDIRQQLQQLQQQNQALQEQLRQQQALIDALSRQVKEIQTAKPPASADQESIPAADKTSSSLWSSAGGLINQVHIGGEGGVALFNSGSAGQFPHTEFRLDEARLFVEAPIWGPAYFYSELNLATREQDDISLHVGELYLEVENLSRLWGQDRQPNLRAGRMYIPFGEEYQTRYAIDNPLISHSLEDLWGVDEGVELYGQLGKFSYATAVQNGGNPDTVDFTGDKSVAGRVGFDPNHWLHLSVSGMRTGDLSTQQDRLSALWFGGGFFRSLDSAHTTDFHANLVEGDVQVRLPHGSLKAFGGYIRYDDNSSVANNGRDVYYYSVEGVHNVVGRLYGAARFSQILAPAGFPITGNGDFGDYFFGPLTRELWRLSLGLGYRWSENLLLKAEYSFERGHTAQGEQRDHEDLFGVEAAFKF